MCAGHLLSKQTICPFSTFFLLYNFVVVRLSMLLELLWRCLSSLVSVGRAHKPNRYQLVISEMGKRHAQFYIFLMICLALSTSCSFILVIIFTHFYCVSRYLSIWVCFGMVKVMCFSDRWGYRDEMSVNAMAIIMAHWHADCMIVALVWASHLSNNNNNEYKVKIILQCTSKRWLYNT